MEFIETSRAFRAALDRLKEVLAEPENDVTRDAAIKRFEFTFELFWKSLKAYAEESGLEAYSPRDSMRTAFQLRLIQEHPDWLRMIEGRNLTSHTYNEVTAETIYAHLPSYLLFIRQAHAELTRRVKG